MCWQKYYKANLKQIFKLLQLKHLSRLRVTKITFFLNEDKLKTNKNNNSNNNNNNNIDEKYIWSIFLSLLLSNLFVITCYLYVIILAFFEDVV